MKLLLLGATGLVGRNVLQLALQDQRVRQIIAPTRHPSCSSLELVNPVAQELDTLVEEVAAHSADSMISAVGTTIGKAGSKQAFYQVDYVLPMTFAKPRFSRELSRVLSCHLGSFLVDSVVLLPDQRRARTGHAKHRVPIAHDCSPWNDRGGIEKKSVWQNELYFQWRHFCGLFCQEDCGSILLPILRERFLMAVVAREDRLRVLTSSDLV